MVDIAYSHFWKSYFIPLHFDLLTSYIYLFL